MTKAKIPTAWRHLYPQDQVGTRLPKHRIDAHIQELEAEGWKFACWPSERGYWIVCLERPANAPVH